MGMWKSLNLSWVNCLGLAGGGGVRLGVVEGGDSRSCAQSEINK
jgi:hypothetical protein